MTVSRDELGELVQAGLVADIFRMERSHALLRTIGQSAATLNAPESGNFGDLFGSLQSALITDCIMAAARIYDPPSKRYPSRCMRHILEFLKAQKNELPDIREPYQLRLSLRADGLEEKLGPLIDKGGPAFAEGLADHFLALLDDPARSTSIEALKRLRDKALAHNEHVALVAGPTWISLGELLDLAKKLVGILGWAYLGTAYQIDGRFTLSEDAIRPSRSLERLIAMLRPEHAANAT